MTEHRSPPAILGTGADGRRLLWAMAYAVAHDLAPSEAAALMGPAAAPITSWEGFGRLLRAHRCGTLAYHLLQQPEVRAACDPPEATIAALRVAYTTAFARVAMEPAILDRLLAALDDAEVPALAVKGLAVGAWLYPDPVLREHLDIDLLAPPSRAAAVEAVLTGFGYRRAYEPPLYPGERAATVDYGHPAGGLHIDVAYDPLRLFWTDPSGEDALFERWWQRRQALPVGGYRLPTLGPEDQFMQLARHLQFHDYFRVNSFLDLLLLIRRQGERLDWELVGREAADAGIGGGLFRTLELAERLYGVAAPAGRRALRPGFPVRALHRRIWGEELAAVRDRPAAAGNPMIPRFLSLRGPHPVAGLALHALDRHRARTLRYLVQRLLPPPAWLRQTYGGEDGGRRYPGLLRRHWRHLGRLRRQVDGHGGQPETGVDAEG